MEFYLRKTPSGGGVEWFPITFNRDELIQKVKLHPNDDVDVAVIDITGKINDIINAITKKEIENNIGIPATLSNLDLPGNKPIPIEVTSDIVVASYPNGFYDAVNKFPIVRQCLT